MPERPGRRKDAVDRAGRIRSGLQTAILEQRLQPGTKLGEDEIGAIYGASRTIVRSALQALAHEGIVVIEKNRGAFVASPSRVEAQQVFEARRLVEPELAKRAALHADARWQERLKAHLAEERAATESGNDRAAIRLSGEFHMLVARLADHAVYADILGGLIARSSLILLLYRSSQTHLCGSDHHAAIVEAILRHDGAAAAALMVDHLVELEQGLDLKDRPVPVARLAELLA